jgi:hypothetical protein
VKKSMLAVSLFISALTASSAHAAKPVAQSAPTYQALPFQLTAPISSEDVKAPNAGGDFAAYVDVPGKSGCSLTGHAKIVGMGPQGSAIRFDLEPGASLKCDNESAKQVGVSLVEEDGTPWIPPQINLCTIWEGSDAAKHPKCTKRTVAAYTLSTGVARITGL